MSVPTWKDLSSELQAKFTLDNTVPILDWYIDESGITEEMNWTDEYKIRF